MLAQIDRQEAITAVDIAEEIGDESPTKRTIRDCLSVMEELGLLDSAAQAGSQPTEYYPASLSTEGTGGYSPRQPTKNSPFPYPGGKAHIADWIISQMPEHDTYIEVFGGSGAVIYNKARSKYEIYNDINDDLAQFFDVLRNDYDALADWLARVPYSRTLYERWVESFYEGYRPDDPVERAGRFFALRYMQYLGETSGPNGFKTRATRSPARTFNNARQHLSELAERFSEVIIENRDYREILDAYDSSQADVLFYCDPPYIGSEGYYADEFDHQTFIETLSNVENDWLVSYSEIPEELNDYMVISRNARHKMARATGNRTEHLVCNFDPEERPLFVNMYSNT